MSVLETTIGAIVLGDREVFPPYLYAAYRSSILRAPHLPVERWKIPLLTLDGDGRPELDLVVPLAPLPRLFTLAWQRILDGDTPRFDELERAR